MRVRFGEFQLDADTREVFGAGGPVHLAPKAFELLRILLEARPRAVAKDQLHTQLWPDTFVSEANLALIVSDLRAALGDSAAQPRFIRTVPRFGYAFCGTAATLAGATSAEAARCFVTVNRKRLPLRVGVSTLGRDADADVRIDAPGISRQHARIHVTAAGATVQDLDSKNGTFVRGVRVTAPVPVHDGDEIRLGVFVLTFRTDEPAAATETIKV